ncbi:hypothetical protein [Bacteroides sp. An51A]|uniref:hypothetical protein n=1 Tax=Bacteroides sp. An51A TaxID=1965640 RepID=UPI000B393CD9|nr:hypothetical protein [Bacteroides sp. An51A]OUN81151.1 hypothetical protein B5G04_07930 [Bacteroides sp. An51A]
MKKHTFYYIALSALAMLTGCSEEDGFGLKAIDGNRSLTATIEHNDLSRTAVSEEGQVTWTETDAIGVFGTSSRNVKFAYQSATDNGGTATFRGNFPEEESMEQAYYPYQEDATLSGNALTLNLPSEYTYTGNSNAPMLGVKNTDGTFTFKHLTGLLRITINNVPEEADRFVIASSAETDAPYLAGQATVTDIQAEEATLSITANGSKEIVYTLGSLTTGTGFRTFFVPLPVGEYPQLSVSLYAKDSTEPYFTKTISDITVSRAVMIDMPILDAQTGAQYVLSENTTEITEDMAEHISVSPDDNTTLIYESGIAEEDVPEIGEIIFAKVSDDFPDGFLGKVSSIKENGDGSYMVETEVASLSEAFDELYVNETVILEPEMAVQSRADDGKTHAFDIELNFGKEHGYTANDESYSISMNANYGVIFSFNVSLDKKDNIQRAGVVLQNAFEAGAHVVVNGTFPHNEEDGELEIPLTEVRLRNIPLANGIIQITPVLTTTMVARLNGEMVAELGYSTKYKTYSGADYVNGQWVTGSSERGQGGDNKSPWKLDGAIDGRFALEGNIFGGFAVGFDGRLYNRDDMKLSIGAEAGMNIGGQVEINSNENADVLEQVLSNAKFTSSLTINGTLAVDASLIAPGDKKLEGGITLFEATLFKREVPLFPNIKKPEAKVTPEETTEVAPEPTYTADIETEVQGPTLMEDVEIAYAIEDEETGEVLEVSDPIPYSGDVEGELMGGETPIEEVKPVKAAFKELKQEVSYAVYPIVISPFLNSVIKKYDISLKQQAININIAPQKSERDILIEFYNSTGGDNWTNNENWCSDKPLDTWYGIRLDHEGKVQNISLLNNNLTGEAYLADLTNLDYLVLGENKLTNITLSNLPLLRYLEAGMQGPSVTPFSINMSGLTNLDQLTLNNVENFDLSGLTTLRSLSIGSYQLTDLDITELTNLETLIVTDQIASLNVKGLHKLNYILCSRIQATQLDFSELESLEEVKCYDNLLLKDLTIAKSKNLTKLTCNNNEQLENLDLTGTEKLERIECKYNQLTKLDLSTSPNVNLLWCGYNKLKILNINSDKLENLSCSDNQLSNIDFSNVRNLTSLVCSNNQLSNLDISILPRLQYLNCDYNQLKELDFSNNQEITEIHCDNNLFTDLEFPNLDNLTYLSCSDNPLKILDVSKLKSLQKLFCDYEHQMEIVDISGISNSIEHLQFMGSFVKKVYISTQEENYKRNFLSWGELDSQKYPEPNYYSGYQYPEFIYK